EPRRAARCRPGLPRARDGVRRGEPPPRRRHSWLRAVGGGRGSVVSADAVPTSAALGVRATLRAGLAQSPEMLRGVGLTLALAVVGAVGKVLVPLAVQRTVDEGIGAPGGVDMDAVLTSVGLAL